MVFGLPRSGATREEHGRTENGDDKKIGTWLKNFFYRKALVRHFIMREELSWTCRGPSTVCCESLLHNSKDLSTHTPFPKGVWFFFFFFFL